jgi:ribonuclease HI
MPAGTSTQKAELIVLTRDLTLEKGKQLNIYTDSKPAFLVLQAFAVTWKERGLLTGRQSPIKHVKEILQLLEAIHLPNKVAVTHYQTYQKDLSWCHRGTARQTKGLNRQH